MVAQLHAQQNKHLLSVEFSQREHCSGFAVKWVYTSGFQPCLFRDPL